MRVFCFIFIVYIFVLLAQPCQDAFGDLDTSGHKKDAVAHVDRPAPSDEHSDECSPFCICSCCGHQTAARFPSASMSMKADHVLISADISDYTAPSTSTFQNSIWQPPKA
ncbi:MAG: hypothetical protein AAB288_14270 [Acidobacteriota bacterium]